jgi:hemerythrin superfamily protein
MGIKMNENKILPIMVKDHCRIEKLLDELEHNVEKEHPMIKETFYKFEWELEKHLFTEEKAIFTLYNPEDASEGYKMLPELTEQHNYLINQLDKWRKDIRNNKKIIGFYDFKNFLIKHKNFEEKEVYPRLEQTLNERQKQHIISRINEITYQR